METVERQEKWRQIVKSSEKGGGHCFNIALLEIPKPLCADVPIRKGRIVGGFYGFVAGAYTDDSEQNHSSVGSIEGGKASDGGFCFEEQWRRSEGRRLFPEDESRALKDELQPESLQRHPN